MDHDASHYNQIKKFCIAVVVTFVIFALIKVSGVYVSLYREAVRSLEQVVARVNDDISYKNGQWDVFKYIADPLLPDSSALYILTTDGYIIDRWRPIDGFLDTSEYTYYLQFTDPQTIQTPTQESWRMYTTRILKDGTTEGIVLLAAHINPGDDEATLDTQLRREMVIVTKDIRFDGDKLNVSAVDVRKTSYDTSVRIVDRFNNLLLKSNNSNSLDTVPSYIDRSYVQQQLNAPKVEIVRHKQTGEPFVVVREPYVVDGENTAVIIAGTSIAYIMDIVREYLLITLILLIVSILFVSRWYKKLMTPPHPKLKVLEFDRGRSQILIDEAKVEIPAETFQFALCDAVFSEPSRLWTVEELIQRFGDKSGNHWRKVYDAMLLINKRAETVLPVKLIMVKEKQFFLNPIFRDVVEV
ncbi:MAG: hypothetical protein ACEQSA_04090 [Weeksellaceae bacterium]